MSQFPPEILAKGAEVIRFYDDLESLRRDDPSAWYVPSKPSKEKPYANQLGFHQAPHTIRLLCPGNGWGKTTAAAAECNEWGKGSNRWQKTPSWPVVMVWFVKQRDQFELQVQAIEESVLGTVVVRRDNVFTWPNGSTLTVAWADDRTTWKKYQGIAADLVVFDELPPFDLVKEMLFRRRAKRKTRFIFAMTDTEGDTWIEAKIYKQWLDHHAAQGVPPEKALMVQSHPDIWVWDRGGVGDNPAADDEDRRWYESIPVGSSEERKSRLQGGFFTHSMSGVFDGDGLKWVEEKAKASKPHPLYTSFKANPLPFESTNPDKLRECLMDFSGGPMKTGTLLVYEPPKPGRQYVIGADFSYGTGRNQDFACVLDVTARGEESGRVREVASLYGANFRLDFHRYLYALLKLYNSAFLVGERQVGLFTLRRLWDEYGYTYMYRDRNEAAPHPSVKTNGELGWHRRADDQIIANVRSAILNRSVEIRTPIIIDQLKRLRFVPKPAGPSDDARLTMELRNKADAESPDGLMALGYAIFGVEQVPRFIDQRPQVNTYLPEIYAAGMGNSQTSINRGAVGWIKTA